MSRKQTKQQTSRFGPCQVLVKMANNHFDAIPANFAQTIAKNLLEVGLVGNFWAKITDIDHRNIGRGKIKVIRESNQGNSLEIVVEPDIPNSCENRFRCILYCTEAWPRSEVLTALTQPVETVQVTSVVETKKEEETMDSKHPTKVIYPNPNDPCYTDILCQLLNRVDNHEEMVDVGLMIAIIKDLFPELQDAGSAMISRKVINSIARKEDSENTILVKIPWPYGANRGFKLGQLGKYLISKPVVEELETDSEAIETKETPEEPEPVMPPEPLFEISTADIDAGDITEMAVDNMTETVRQSINDRNDLIVLHELFRSLHNCMHAFIDQDRSGRINTAAIQLEKVIGEEMVVCEIKINQANKANTTLTNIHEKIHELITNG